MRNFYKIFAAVFLSILLIFTGANLLLITALKDTEGRPYKVEINRITREIEENGLNSVNLSDYTCITNIEQKTGSSNTFFQIDSDNGGQTDSNLFFQPDSDYAIRLINGKIYRFDYTVQTGSANRKLFLICNLSLAIMALLTIGILLFADTKILKPFHTLRNVPYELSKGNLTVPMKESKNRFFGRFIWGVDMLRENMEQQKQRELQLQRDKKTLLLSISHDIKTPLSAIKLYSQALSKGLYKSADKQTEIARNINAKADEIEAFVSQIIQASNEDFLNLEVVPGEFYLSHLINNISVYYKEKLSLIRVAFSVSSFSDCILKGDPDRSVEVLQNIIENAVKYGNGHSVEIRFAEEEDCQLITIINEGCTLPESELPHIFDSFWRGSNAGSSSGSGLGLYICRQLMHKMGGEIFAEIRDSCMHMTAVFPKAV
ncbi:MAG: HAMP domain-containing sensor histidine kinase [Eubacteriales bacterium]|nr:HAMP domain-containing sensor histidine kinase [Eubacteriales bacterium]